VSLPLRHTDLPGDARGSLRRWHNHLPEWIIEALEAEPTRRRRGWQITLQAIADRCDGPDSAGNLMTCYGGDDLARAVGSRRTLFRHLRQLEAKPRCWVVCLGQMRSAGGYAFNLYGIPGVPGSLDAYRRTRIDQRMDHIGGGVYVPTRFAANEQLDLLPGLAPGSRSGTSSTSGTFDLRDTGELLARVPGAAGEAERLRYVAAAEHALRVGEQPLALFRWIIRGRRWDVITLADEDRAAARLKAHLHGSEVRRRVYDPLEGYQG